MALNRRFLSFGGGGAVTFTLRFLGIAGGIKGRNGQSGGGGGAGEYLEKTSLLGELSQNYQVIVGAGKTPILKDQAKPRTFQTNIKSNISTDKY